MSLLNRPRGRKDQRQEKELARSFGGKRTPNSGALGVKGDVHTAAEMIEAKTTAKVQYTIKLKDLKKLEEQARIARKRPVMVIAMNDEAPDTPMNREWVLIPRRDYEELRHEQFD